MPVRPKADILTDVNAFLADSPPANITPTELRSLFTDVVDTMATGTGAVGGISVPSGGDRNIQFNSAGLLAANSGLNYTASSGLEVANSGSFGGSIKLYNRSSIIFTESTVNGIDTVTIISPTGLATSYTITLPIDDGAVSGILQTNGSGITRWAQGFRWDDGTHKINVGDGDYPAWFSIDEDGYFLASLSNVNHAAKFTDFTPAESGNAVFLCNQAWAIETSGGIKVTSVSGANHINRGAYIGIHADAAGVFWDNILGRGNVVKLADGSDALEVTGVVRFYSSGNNRGSRFSVNGTVAGRFWDDGETSGNIVDICNGIYAISANGPVQVTTTGAAIRQVILSQNVNAGWFTDNSASPRNTVELANGTYAINVTGAINTIGLSDVVQHTWRGAAGQTADLVQWKAPNGSVLGRLNNSGVLGVGTVLPTNKYASFGTGTDIGSNCGISIIDHVLKTGLFIEVNADNRSHLAIFQSGVGFKISTDAGVHWFNSFGGGVYAFAFDGISLPFLIRSAQVVPGGDSAIVLGTSAERWSVGYFNRLTAGTVGEPNAQIEIKPSGNTTGLLIRASANQSEPIATFRNADDLEVGRVGSSGLFTIRASISTVQANLGGILKTFVASTGNTGTAIENDLFSYSVASGILGRDGDYLEFDAFGNYITGTKRLRLYYGPTLVFDGLPTGVNTGWSLKSKIYRDGSLQRVVNNFNDSSSFTQTNFTFASGNNGAATSLRVTASGSSISGCVQRCADLKWFPANP